MSLFNHYFLPLKKVCHFLFCLIYALKVKKLAALCRDAAIQGIHKTERSLQHCSVVTTKKSAEKAHLTVGSVFNSVL
jgi:hypothetical protein